MKIEYWVVVIERKTKKEVDRIGPSDTIERALKVERGVNINISPDYRTTVEAVEVQEVPQS